MILYLDASALGQAVCGRARLGGGQPGHLSGRSNGHGTGQPGRGRSGSGESREEAERSLRAFREEWLDLVRVQVTEFVIARADVLAWEHSLRGYDALHLAAALVWQDMMGKPVTFATFDRHLWAATQQVGLTVYPNDLPAMLER